MPTTILPIIKDAYTSTFFQTYNYGSCSQMVIRGGFDDMASSNERTFVYLDIDKGLLPTNINAVKLHAYFNTAYNANTLFRVTAIPNYVGGPWTGSDDPWIEGTHCFQPASQYEISYNERGGGAVYDYFPFAPKTTVEQPGWSTINLSYLQQFEDMKNKKGWQIGCTAISSTKCACSFYSRHYTDLDLRPYVEIIHGLNIIPEIVISTDDVIHPMDVTFTGILNVTGGSEIIKDSEWVWSIDGQYFATGTEVHHTFEDPGTYMISTTCTDENYIHYTTSTQIVVKDYIIIPQFEVTNNHGVVPLLVSFTDTTIIIGTDYQQYIWWWEVEPGKFLKGRGHSRSLTNMYLVPGVYDVGMHIYDEDEEIPLYSVYKKAYVFVNDHPSGEQTQLEMTIDDGEFGSYKHEIHSKHDMNVAEENKISLHMWTTSQNKEDPPNNKIMELRGDEKLLLKNTSPYYSETFIVGSEIKRWDEFVSENIKTDDTKAKVLKTWSGR